MTTEEETLFEKYFTLDEAVALLPFVKQTFMDARKELMSLKDEVILYERMFHMQEQGEGIEDAGDTAIQTMSEVLRQKWEHYEETFYSWVNVLVEKGIQVRDFRKGLIDFPYRSKSGQEYFLCWHWGEEGLFYFHDVFEGFGGRQPITLLPE